MSINGSYREQSGYHEGNRVLTPRAHQVEERWRIARREAWLCFNAFIKGMFVVYIFTTFFWLIGRAVVNAIIYTRTGVVPYSVSYIDPLIGFAGLVVLAVITSICACTRCARSMRDEVQPLIAI